MLNGWCVSIHILASICKPRRATQLEICCRFFGAHSTVIEYFHNFQAEKHCYFTVRHNSKLYTVEILCGGFLSPGLGCSRRKWQFFFMVWLDIPFRCLLFVTFEKRKQFTCSTCTNVCCINMAHTDFFHLQ